ncbi:DNA mismatch repair protein MutS [Gluconobacter japonicus]|uniref:Smr/MutS family protein n=1 Tax=Gluconobacter frateurii TaxID=38308 RepID=UPI0007CFF9C5|nr:Smr/MutS family protein [Gluconobacter frateurii]OAG74865.1 DNA mismatch repair protein MutS [Gluconobacter japonicus]UMM07525.1 Smr/MutS family protein [Gluconobacter frateurii]
MAKRVLREEEAALWRMVVRDIEPLHPDRPKSRPAPVVVTPTASTPEKKEKLRVVSAPANSELSFRAMLSRPVIRRPRPQDLRIGVRAPGLDDTSWKRLSRGELKIDAKLDLHGYIVQDAFERLIEFMHRAKSRNWRCVEVVTGLGSGATSGLIRRELPLWLQRSDIRPMVLAVVHPHSANHGSVRILLRTKRR